MNFLTGHPLVAPLFGRVSPAASRQADPRTEVVPAVAPPSAGTTEPLSAEEVNAACRVYTSTHDLYDLCRTEDRVQLALAVARGVEAARATLRRAMPDIEAVTEEVA
jgi:hypothetical protein